jgi:hypothetical protein
MDSKNILTVYIFVVYLFTYVEFTYSDHCLVILNYFSPRDKILAS